MHPRLLCAVALVLVACGSSSSSPSDGTSGPGSPNGPGSSGTHATSNRFVGTWDVVAYTGKDGHGTLTVGADKLSLHFGTFDLDVDNSTTTPKIEGTAAGETGTPTATREATNVDVGDLPYSVGGRWQFVGKRSDRCDATVDDGSFSMDCSNLRAPFDRSLLGYDIKEDKRLGTGHTVALRKDTVASSFGSLGGHWSVVAPVDKCDVTIAGDTFSADCIESGNAYGNFGSITIVFTDDTATGTTGGGAEIVARKL